MLYVIVGDGTGNKTEIEGSLADLMAKAAEAEQEFWFAIQPGEKATTAYIVKWFKDNEVYFDSIGTKIQGAAEQRDADAIVEFMQEFQADGVELLALFVDVDSDIEEDAPLMALVEAAVAEDITVRLLNSQMTKISFAEEGAEEVEEEQSGTLTGEEEGEEQVEEAAEFTEADLKKMTVPELTAMAKGQGLDVKSIGKGKGDLIKAIIDQQENAETPEEGDEEGLEAALEADSGPGATNGYADPSAALDAWIKQILRSVGKALIDAAK